MDNEDSCESDATQSEITTLAYLFVYCIGFLWIARIAYKQRRIEEWAKKNATDQTNSPSPKVIPLVNAGRFSQLGWTKSMSMDHQKSNTFSTPAMNNGLPYRRHNQNDGLLLVSNEELINNQNSNSDNNDEKNTKKTSEMISLDLNHGVSSMNNNHEDPPDIFASLKVRVTNREDENKAEESSPSTCSSNSKHVCLWSLCCLCMTMDGDCKASECCRFMIMLGRFKRILFPVFVHFTDEASDIGVSVIFYNLWQKKERVKNDENDLRNICEHLDMRFMFFASLYSLIQYRIISAVLVYRMTVDWKRVLRQMFDLELLEAIRINFMLDLNYPCNPMRWLHHLEATYESSLQALLQFVFLAKTNAFGTSGGNFVVASFLWSLISIVNRLVAEDSTVFVEAWKSAEFGSEWGLIWKCRWSRVFSHQWWLHHEWKDEDSVHGAGAHIVRIIGLSFNSYYLERHIWRILDATLTILIAGFVWLGMGGLSIFILLVVEGTLLCSVGIWKNNSIYVSGLIGSLFVLTSDFSRTFSLCFFIYRKTIHLCILIICSFLINHDLDGCWSCPSFKTRRRILGNRITAVLFIYCCVAWFVHYLWWFVRIRGGLREAVSTDRKIQDLVLAGDLSGLTELVSFGMKLDEHSHSEDALLETIRVSITENQLLDWIDVVETLKSVNMMYRWNSSSVSECFTSIVSCQCHVDLDEMRHLVSSPRSPSTMITSRMSSLSEKATIEAAARVAADKASAVQALDMSEFVNKLVSKLDEDEVEFELCYASMLSNVWNESKSETGEGLRMFLDIFTVNVPQYFSFESTKIRLFRAASRDGKSKRTVCHQIVSQPATIWQNQIWLLLLTNIPNTAEVWKDCDNDGWNCFMLALKHLYQPHLWKLILDPDCSVFPLSKLSDTSFYELWVGVGINRGLKSSRSLVLSSNIGSPQKSVPDSNPNLSLTYSRNDPSLDAEDVPSFKNDGEERYNALAIAILYQNNVEVWDLLLKHCKLTAGIWGSNFGTRNAYQNGLIFACEKITTVAIWRLLVYDGTILDPSLWEMCVRGDMIARIFLEHQWQLGDSLLSIVLNSLSPWSLMCSKENRIWDVFDTIAEKQIGERTLKVVQKKLNHYQQSFVLLDFQVEMVGYLDVVSMVEAVKKDVRRHLDWVAAKVEEQDQRILQEQLEQENKMLRKKFQSTLKQLIRDSSTQSARSLASEDGRILKKKKSKKIMSKYGRKKTSKKLATMKKHGMHLHSHSLDYTRSLTYVDEEKTDGFMDKRDHNGWTESIEALIFADLRTSEFHLSEMLANELPRYLVMKDIMLQKLQNGLVFVMHLESTPNDDHIAYLTTVMQNRCKCGFLWTKEECRRMKSDIENELNKAAVYDDALGLDLDENRLRVFLKALLCYFVDKGAPFECRDLMNDRWINVDLCFSDWNCDRLKWISQVQESSKYDDSSSSIDDDDDQFDIDDCRVQSELRIKDEVDKVVRYCLKEDCNGFITDQELMDHCHIAESLPSKNSFILGDRVEMRSKDERISKLWILFLNRMFFVKCKRRLSYFRAIQAFVWQKSSELLALGNSTPELNSLKLSSSSRFYHHSAQSFGRYSDPPIRAVRRAVVIGSTFLSSATSVSSWDSSPPLPADSADQSSRIAELERRNKQLEERIAQLESAPSSLIFRKPAQLRSASAVPRIKFGGKNRRRMLEKGVSLPPSPMPMALGLTDRVDVSPFPSTDFSLSTEQSPVISPHTRSGGAITLNIEDESSESL